MAGWVGGALCGRQCACGWDQVPDERLSWQPLYVAVSAGCKALALMLAESGAEIEGEDEPAEEDMYNDRSQQQQQQQQHQRAFR